MVLEKFWLKKPKSWNWFDWKIIFRSTYNLGLYLEFNRQQIQPSFILFQRFSQPKLLAARRTTAFSISKFVSIISSTMVKATWHTRAEGTRKSHSTAVSDNEVRGVTWASNVACTWPGELFLARLWWVSLAIDLPILLHVLCLRSVDWIRFVRCFF